MKKNIAENEIRKCICVRTRHCTCFSFSFYVHLTKISKKGSGDFAAAVGFYSCPSGSSVILNHLPKRATCAAYTLAQRIILLAPGKWASVSVEHWKVSDTRFSILTRIKNQVKNRDSNPRLLHLDSWYSVPFRLSKPERPSRDSILDSFLNNLFSIHKGIKNQELSLELRLPTDCQLTFEWYCLILMHSSGQGKRC